MGETQDSPTIDTELEAALTRVKELEAMFENDVPSVSRALEQRDYAVGALKTRDRIWQQAMREYLQESEVVTVSRRFIQLRDQTARAGWTESTASGNIWHPFGCVCVKCKR